MKNSTYSFEEVKAIHDLPITTLIFKAQEIIHRFHNPAVVELHTLCSVKTGGCSENCAYCSQSSHHKTFIKESSMLSYEAIIQKAVDAKNAGAVRFSLSYAWKTIPSEAHMDFITKMIHAIKGMGMQVCCTMGMLNAKQAQQLKEAGCDCYNHNIDTSREYYKEIVTTHSFDDRLNTIKNIHQAGMMVCCGGIIGMGESIDDRINMIAELANMQPHPDCVPINALIPIEGTRLQNQLLIDPIAFVRVIATARITLPHATIQLAGGRHEFSEEMQALCFVAGANGFHLGEKLLTAPNSESLKDFKLLEKLGLQSAKMLCEICV